MKDLFNYLVATDGLDEFLGLKLPDDVKEELCNLADDYKNNIVTDDEIQEALMKIEANSKINYELLLKYFKEQL